MVTIQNGSIAMKCTDMEMEFPNVSIEAAEFFARLSENPRINIVPRKKGNDVIRYQIFYKIEGKFEKVGGLDCKKFEYYISNKFASDFELHNLFEHSEFELLTPSSGHKYYAIKGSGASTLYEKKLLEVIEKIEESK